MKKDRNLAIIPARSGSKGLIDKNIKEIQGKPLIAYTIEAAQKSGIFEEIMVSTDSEKYAAIIRKYNVSIPFLRSKENSSDTASSWDMVLEVIEKYKRKKRYFDSFCLLQPTSPLRTYQDIQNAYRIYEEKKAVSVVSVSECEHSPLWTGTLNEEHELNNFITKNADIQRQKQKKYYRINGAVYIMQINEFLARQNLYGERSYAYIMDKERSIDIDDGYDFCLAEFLISKRGNDESY